MIDKEENVFDFASLHWHQQNDVPGERFTPIWNEYLRSGCVAKMTEEEALKQKLYFFGDLEAAVCEITELSELWFGGLVENGMDEDEAKKKVAQEIPYEYLFLFMM